jgi:hypothetical protein
VPIEAEAKLNYRYTRLPVIMAAISVCVLGSRSAHAQTPGAIPDPGTYQGSTQLQQEQDRQAERFRQQSAQPSQAQPQPGQGPYQGNAPAPFYNSGVPDCLDRLAQQPELAPLAKKVSLGHSDLHQSALLGIQSVATASDRPLLQKWSAGRRTCLQEAKRVNIVTRDYSVQAKRLDELASQIIIDMIDKLADGKLTYGEFNRQRTKNALVVDQTP